VFAELVAAGSAAGARARGLRSRTTTIDDWRLRVWHGGRSDGEPWLLLHGMGATSVTYLPLIGALRRDCRLVIPELSANGGSRGPGAALGVRRGAEVVTRLIESEFPDRPPTIVGVSLGGWMAIKLAAARPELAERLVLVVPGGYRDQDWRQIESMVSVREPADIAAMWRAMFVRPPWFLQLGRFGLYRLYTTPTVREVLAMVREEDAFGDEDLARLTMPVALIWGAGDTLFRPEIGERMRAALPDATLTVIERAGHAVQWERPRQFLGAVERFRREHPLRSTGVAAQDRE
jgi:pimeloyl-ACP methyl ester carboxylesterase